MRQKLPQVPFLFRYAGRKYASYHRLSPQLFDLCPLEVIAPPLSPLLSASLFPGIFISTNSMDTSDLSWAYHHSRDCDVNEHCNS
jgi:hypothetical protein